MKNITITLIWAFAVYGFTGLTARADDGDLVVNLNEISETMKIYPYHVGNALLEIIVVKASDGSVRTAFNTCQICYASGRAVFTQEGSTLICQNCGKRFRISNLGRAAGGCNPVPIADDERQISGDKLIISRDYLASKTRWKKP